MSDLTPDMPPIIRQSRFSRPPSIPASAFKEARAHAAAAAAAGLARRFQTMGKSNESRKLKDTVSVIESTTTPTPTPIAVSEPLPEPVTVAAPEPVTVDAPEPVIETLSAVPIEPVYQKGLVKALFIGIQYQAIPSVALQSCIQDIENSKQKIQELYPDCASIRVLTESSELKPTRKNILESIAWLVEDIKPGQHIFFHYSGHGGQLVDKSGAYKSIFENCIYPCKGKKLQIILDDEIRKALIEKVPKGSKCFIVMDSYSGNATISLEHTWQTTEDHTLYYVQDLEMPSLEGKIIVLSSCQTEDAPISHEAIYSQTGGVLSSILPQILDKNNDQLEMKDYMWSILKTLKARGCAKIPLISASRPMGPAQSIDLSM
jgi:hypothetical protein